MAGQQGYLPKSYAKDNEYYTPKSVVRYFGEFDYDPATTPEKAAEFGVKHFDTIETNGLEQDWTKFKRIWINPPFTMKQEFIKKAQETYNQTKADIYILLPIEFLTTAKFHNSIRGFRLFIPSGRLNFESGLGKKGKSPAFGSVVVRIDDEYSVELIDKQHLSKENNQ